MDNIKEEIYDVISDENFEALSELSEIVENPTPKKKPKKKPSLSTKGYANYVKKGKTSITYVIDNVEYSTYIKGEYKGNVDLSYKIEKGVVKIIGIK